MEIKKLEAKPEIIEQSDDSKTEEKLTEKSEDKSEEKIDGTNLQQKQSSANKFLHITKKKNIIAHNLNKNNDKKRFDSSDYYMKKHAEKKP